METNKSTQIAHCLNGNNSYRMRVELFMMPFISDAAFLLLARKKNEIRAVLAIHPDFQSSDSLANLPALRNQNEVMILTRDGECS